MKAAVRWMATVALAVALVSVGVSAGMKITVKFDKGHDFSTAKTVAYHPEGAGKVLMLTNLGDDPKQVLAQLDPMFKAAMEAEFPKRGVQVVKPGPADLLIQYYLLVGPNSDAQVRGQFVGAIPPWGLPDFEMTTTALKIYEQGTIVMDLVDTKTNTTVWRGIAEAEVNRQRTPEQRAKVIQNGIAEMLKKFPPKGKK